MPKPLQDALGLSAGSTVDINQYGPGLQVPPTSSTARLTEDDGVLVASGETAIDDETVFGFLDGARR